MDRHVLRHNFVPPQPLDQTCSVLQAYDLCTRVWGDIRRAASRESYTMACATVVPSSGFFDLPPKREVAGGKAAGMPSAKCT